MKPSRSACLRAALAAIACAAAFAAPASTLLEGPPPGDEPAKGVVISGHDAQAANFVLTGYSERAAALYRPFLDHSSLQALRGMAPALLVTDLQGITAPGRIADLKFDDPQRLIDPRVSALVLPTGSTRAIEAPYWPVPGYGVAWLRADNGGRGYALERPGLAVLNLNHEFARTHLRLLLQRARALPRAQWPEGVKQGLDAARLALEQAGAATGEQRARHADQSLAHTLHAGDDLELHLARRAIPAVRMGRHTVTVVDAAGRPVPQAHLRYRQLSHDFLFGVVESFGFTAKTPSPAEHRRVFQDLRERGFNHFTVSAFWDKGEPEPGHYPLAEWIRSLGAQHAAEAGMSLKMHGLLQEAVPRHAKKLPAAEFSRASRRYFDAALELVQADGALRDAVTIWQAANEPSTNHYAQLDDAAKTELLRATAARLHERAPKSLVMVNDVHADWGQRWSADAQGGAQRVVSPHEMFEALSRAGVRYDLMGLQWYPGLQTDFFGLLRLQGPLQDFVTTSRVLDRYASLGKPLHITEFALPATFAADWKSGWWRRPWDAELQAEYAERFYTLAFSKPHVREITYWGISDNEPWVVQGGLTTKDRTPKPVLERLTRLIDSWTTRGEAHTDDAGRATLQGFAGDYELTVEKDGRRATQRLRVVERADSTVRVVLAR